MAKSKNKVTVPPTIEKLCKNPQAVYVLFKRLEGVQDRLREVDLRSVHMTGDQHARVEEAQNELYEVLSEMVYDTDEEN